MKRQLTVGQYRGIDLMLFALMTAVFEFVASKVGLMLPYAPFLISVTPVIVAIVMMRWGLWGGIHAVLGGLVFCLGAGLKGDWLLIYGAGYLAGLGALVMLRTLGWERVQKSPGLSMAYGACVLALMVLGRSLLALLLGHGAAETVNRIGMEAITLLFTLVLMWIVRRADGLFEDQGHYLNRLQREEEEGGF